MSNSIEKTKRFMSTDPKLFRKKAFQIYPSPKRDMKSFVSILLGRLDMEFVFFSDVRHMFSLDKRVNLCINDCVVMF